ncbi:hypothetical protein [Acinetobacter nosocomialis]|uniref:hypothetical protein n=1 Tax=Acinetobacter nosocomialis TaxID=106654 RepID=UPI00190071C0|nr:hypothetical protein [Acinetobacter nosocomialis]MBJ8495900.1 hypothetical protein [Acinetobacter nosocomialis]
MSEFKSCPVCQEESEQCLTCASYVVDGERIYYEKLKDFGATQDYELRFIQRIQKHRTTAFFHKGKLYIPSRQGRAVPLAIGLQWEAWQEQQAKVEELKASHHGEVIGHEVHFKKIKQERDELQTLYTQQGINMLKLQKRVDQQGLIIAKAMSIASDLQKSWSMFEIGKKLEQALKGEGK